MVFYTSFEQGALAAETNNLLFYLWGMVSH